MTHKVPPNVFCVQVSCPWLTPDRTPTDPSSSYAPSKQSGMYIFFMNLLSLPVNVMMMMRVCFPGWTGGTWCSAVLKTGWMWWGRWRRSALAPEEPPRESASPTVENSSRVTSRVISTVLLQNHRLLHNVKLQTLSG